MITVSDPAAPNDPQTISVTLTVIDADGHDLCRPVLFNEWVLVGENANLQSFDVWNCGDDTMSYIDHRRCGLAGLHAQFAARPAVSTTPSRSHYQTGSLSVGEYPATITIDSPGADNSPLTIDVNLSIVYAVGGVIFDDEVDPQLNGVEDVTVTVDGHRTATFYRLHLRRSGLWVIQGIPEGNYTVMPVMSECSLLATKTTATGDPPPITIVVNEANAEANGNINFLADCETGACCLDPVCIPGQSKGLCRIRRDLPGERHEL